MDEHIEQVRAAMAEISDLNDKGGKGTTKVQGGKTYTNAVTRVEVFRKHFGYTLGIDTEVLFPVDGVMMIAKISEPSGRVIGSGHSYAKTIAPDKSLEKLETVAIGRALASLGLSGGEYASDAEMNTWQDRYEQPGIGIEKGPDDVPPEEWITERMANLEAFVFESKAPTQINFETRVEKVESDPIFTKLDANHISMWQRTSETLRTKLKERLSQ